MEAEEQFEKVCKGQFKELHKKLDKSLRNDEELNGRLFVDNGDMSLQSKVNNNTKTNKIVIGVVSVFGTAIVWLLISSIAEWLG